jgi:uncharacterized protein YjbJ (UPF0337 family)
LEDRVVGSAKEINGAVKQVVGTTVGDAKLESDGKADKVEGKVGSFLAILDLMPARAFNFAQTPPRDLV